MGSWLYVGALTLQERINLEKIIQFIKRPIEGLKKYYQAQYKYNGQLINCSCDIRGFY